MRAQELEHSLANARAWLERYWATLDRARTEAQARAGAPIPAASQRGHGDITDPFEGFDRMLTVVLGEAVAAVAKARDGDAGRVVGSVAPRLHGTITRLLGVLDDVENSIEDPAVLATLFKAELQASLARRYCESLMVLGGSGHFAPSRDPVPLGTVVRVGIAETLYHRRVETRFPLGQDLWIVGYAGPAVIHMLSALVDNALGYSPPDEPVGVRVEQHSRGLRIEIEDHGLSMPVRDLAEANALLAGPSPDLVLPRLAERRIGLAVVAQLAAAYKITVGLRAKQAPEQGIVATVALPGQLLVSRGNCRPPHDPNTLFLFPSCRRSGQADGPAGPRRDSRQHTTGRPPCGLRPYRSGDRCPGTLGSAPACGVRWCGGPAAAAAPSPGHHRPRRTRR
ncbi:ATP-binding protein [Streptomyces sp. NPDC093252]|uniref:ATP-binding protein n=1 Tax=Streptomyces sp. NPDC093252 TaxID=3154980 RepID=UPI00343BA7D8